MKEHPIIFSTPMVQAILEGRKTQTRRIVKPQPDDSGLWNDDLHPRSLDSKLRAWNGTIEETGASKEYKCPYGKVADVLWVRETYQKFNVEWSGNLINVYKSDYKNREWEEWTSEEESENKFTWLPSIFMPKIAARIFLEITNVRVERLQDINEEEAKTEGVELLPNNRYKYYLSNYFDCINAQMSYMTLWKKLHGEESWNANPFVWIIEFKKIIK